MANSARKLNIGSLPYLTVYYAGCRKLRLPTPRKRGLRGEHERGLSGFENLAFSFFAAFSSPGESGKQCAVRHEDLKRFFHAGSATVNYALKNLIAADMIEQDKTDRRETKYRVKIKINKEKYIYIDSENMLNRGLEVNGTFYHLTRHEILVYSHIMTACLNPDGEEVFRGSYNKIANTLGMSASSAGKCVRKLINIKAVECTLSGLNNDVESEYKLNPDLLQIGKAKRELWEEDRRERKTRREQRKPEYLKRIEAQDQEAARQSELARRREKAERHANFYMMKLSRDSKYQLINSRLKELEIEIAKAEVFRPNDVAALVKEYEDLRQELDKRMSKIGITRQMLTPQWHCRKCKDTGWRLSDHKICDCYKPPTRWNQ